VIDPEAPHTWPQVRSMTLNEVDLLNRLLDARDEARAIRRRRDKERGR
jgi:hypothetical protein